MRALILIAALAACHGGSPNTPRATTGAIAGLARDHDSHDPVASAQIRVRAQGQFTPLATTSNLQGIYGIDHLPPGRYSLSATFAGQPIEVSNIDVHASETAVVDLVFTLGRDDAVKIDYGDPKASEIERYRPRTLSAQLAIVEGTVSDLGSKARVAGAVITAVGPDGNALQAVSDEQGRYRIEAPPNTYVVSAYYSVSGHGQIEVRRSDIAVAGGEAVNVPLWIELAR
ncbi:MAG: carboxypeptidase-like regulatory domain-containing protein [Proteobacteria bacterium]|nr:carboxypeptidase-like regulatory domain-containing protein [Pseudomonadota bacterium]